MILGEPGEIRGYIVRLPGAKQILRLSLINQQLQGTVIQEILAQRKVSVSDFFTYGED